MMNQQEFNNLSQHLTSVAERIPMRWGKIQNDRTDSQINMFDHDSLESLDAAIQGLHDDSQTYFKKRWFIWKCSQCDEFLFYRHTDVNSNPNVYDQSWDFEFFNNNELKFDLKGSLIPRQIRERLEGVFPNHMEVISFNYNQQSSGVRNHMQNRLFLIHMPFQWQMENHLRANFEGKKPIIDLYINNLRDIEGYNFFDFKGCRSDIIYIRELQNGNLVHNFASSEIN